jgi:hypothetical protein
MRLLSLQYKISQLRTNKHHLCDKSKCKCHTTYRLVIFLVDLDGLVRLARNKAAAAVVKRHRKDARLRVNRAWLNESLVPLEVVT